jgi:hypothetical protein
VVANVSGEKMFLKSLFWTSIVVCLFSLIVRGSASEPNRTLADPFALDGARNIVQEEHFGIVNGKMTSGIRYQNVLGVAGLWAPPYVSSDFTLDITALGERIPTDRYIWHPFHVERSGTVQGIDVSSITMLIPGSRTGVLEVSFTNPGKETRTIPVVIAVRGSLDNAGPADPLGRTGWSFSTPVSRTATARTISDGALLLEQGNLAIALRASHGMSWQDAQPPGQGSVSVPPAGTVKLHITFAIGLSREAKSECDSIAANPELALNAAHAVYAERLADLFAKLPRLESSSPELVQFYNRSLVPLLMNRWDVPEFVLRPYYSTGSVNGGCVGNYLWDFGGIWELFPLVDPEATKTHIKQFLSIDTTKHFAFDPTTGTAFGPWYPVNQEKIVGLIYYYVKHTGDTDFLKEAVDGKTILEHAVANALYGDDLAQPVRLIDYGPSNSHLELRRGYPYNHVMPDLNGRRYETYLLAARLTELTGQPMPHLRQRAEELKAVLKQELWNAQARWFDFQNELGKKELRLTVQMFKLFGSDVLDKEQETGLLSHLTSEREFLGKFGLESMSKTDIAYDPVDYDNGGGGCFTAFPAAIAERLYKSGHPAVSEDILNRILWWGNRSPYWGDSFAANEIAYRRDTPLQCTIDSAAAAQCVIFGMFGVRVEFNGDLRIDPHPPSLAPQMALNGLRLRGHELDILVDGTEYEVRKGSSRIRVPVGQPVHVQGGSLLQGDTATASP